MFNGELYRLWKRANANPGMSVDIGNIVVCDSCSEDYTDSDAEGGMLFDTKAICPACIQRWRDGAEEFGEEAAGAFAHEQGVAGGAGAGEEGGPAAVHEAAGEGELQPVIMGGEAVETHDAPAGAGTGRAGRRHQRQAPMPPAIKNGTSQISATPWWSQ